MLVGQEQLLRRHRLLVGDQREDPVATGILGQPGRVHPAVQLEPFPLALDIRRLGIGPPAPPWRNVSSDRSSIVTSISPSVLVSPRIVSTAAATLARSRCRVRGEASLSRSSASPDSARSIRAAGPRHPPRPCECCDTRPGVPLDAGRLRLVDREAVDQLAFVIVLVVIARQMDPPLRTAARKAASSPRVRGKTLRNRPPLPMDVGHVLGGGQLAVGHVKEVAAAGQLAEQVPGVEMRAIVGGVAALDAELHRHAAVAGDGEDVEQLLEVGAMVLVVSPGDGQPEPAPQGPLLVGGLVIAMEGDGGRIVVQLVEIDGELPDRVDDDGQGQGRDVGIEESVEAAADAIVVERGRLFGAQAQQIGDVPRGPLADAVEGLAGDEEVLEQEQEPGGGGDAAAAVLARQVVTEERLEAEAVEEAVEDRQDTDGGGVEGMAGGAGDAAGPQR